MRLKADIIEDLKRKKRELEEKHNTKSIDYIKCLANINYKTFDKESWVYDKDKILTIKILYFIGIERVYGKQNDDVLALINEALDYMMVSDFKGYCLMTAIIEVLERTV